MAAPFPTAAAGQPHLPYPANSASGIHRREMDELLRQVRGNQLYNRQLSSICQINGLKSTGVKADLQRRIVDLIQETYNASDATRFYQVRQSVFNASNNATKRPNTTKLSGRSAPQVNLPSMPAFNGGSSSNGHSQSFGHPAARPPGMGNRQSLPFYQSPFYSVERAITDVLQCPVMTQHRNSIHVPIKASDVPELQNGGADSPYRIMVFCAGDSAEVYQRPQHIAFPHQSEIKVNGGDFKANLRGLKNKPGSTRPVDITNALRFKPITYTNNVEFTYALTTKKFYLAVYLCQVKSVADLVATVATRHIIPKASVIEELNKKAMDPDVVATSQVLSLKCPLSYMRLDVPCRGTQCTHIQCFDATSYLQLQEQGPQWLCPICNKSVPFEVLAVDEYVKDILSRTSKSLETVTIEPNGRWDIKPAGQDRSQPRNSAATFADDDDEIEISEVSVVGGRNLDTPKMSTPGQVTGTSTPASRTGSSVAPRGAASTSQKRPAPEVIDLTLSSDEDDDEPIQRPAKRQNTGTNGYRESLGFLSSEEPLALPR